MDYKKLLIASIEQCLQELTTEELESLYRRLFRFSVVSENLMPVRVGSVFILVPRDSYDWSIVDGFLNYSTSRYTGENLPLMSFYPSETSDQCWDKKFQETIKYMASS